jgi:HJR/Mrr/RecB family endonuclease
MDLGYSVAEQVHDIGYDLAVEKAGKRVAIQVKYSRSPIPTATIETEIQAAVRMALPVLIVANLRPTTEAAKKLAGYPNLRFALWHDERDNDNLKAALIGLGVYSP